MKQNYHTKAFKEQVVKLALSDLASSEKIATTSRNLWISLYSICKWVKEDKENDQESFSEKRKMLYKDEGINKLGKALKEIFLKKLSSSFTQNQWKKLNSSKNI